MSKDGTPTAGQEATTPPTAKAPDTPTPELADLADRLAAPRAPDPQAKASDRQPDDENAIPVLAGTHRVSLDGGKRTVEITPERIAELIQHDEERERITTAREQLQQETRRYAQLEEFGKKLMSLPEDQRTAVMNIITGRAPAPERNGDESDPHADVDRILDGERPNGHAKPDRWRQQVEQGLTFLLEREQGRETARRETTLGEKVERQMAEFSVFRENPKVAKADGRWSSFARNAIMLELGKSQDPDKDLPGIVARVANQANDIEQGYLGRSRPQPPDPSLRQPTTPVGLDGYQPRTGIEMQRGQVKQDARQFLDQLLGP